MKLLQAATPQNDRVNGRQIAFFAAFILPAYKLLETPSLLAKFLEGDLLLPALLHFLLQGAVLAALLYAASRSEKPLFTRLHERFGKWCLLLYIPLGLYFLLAAILPFLDLEKFVYASFYDTSPTSFTFAAFFLLVAFIAAKGLKTLGRLADIALFIFLIPFAALLFMSVTQADASNLLPFFEKAFGHTTYAFTYTLPHFSDVIFLLPLIGSLSYQKGDGVKSISGYGAGGVCALLFLGVFYGVFSTIAPRTHYAFAKIAQYFPALTLIGRVDLLFVYMLSTVLFLYAASPLAYSVDCTLRLFPRLRRPWLAGILSIGAFVFTLFCNKHYNFFYALLCEKLPPVFLIFNYVLPLVLLFLPTKKPNGKKEGSYA